MRWPVLFILAILQSAHSFVTTSRIYTTINCLQNGKTTMHMPFARDSRNSFVNRNLYHNSALQAGNNKGEPGAAKWQEQLKEYAIPIIAVVSILAVAGSQAGSIQANVLSMLEGAVTKIGGMGNMGFLYFAAVSIAYSFTIIPYTHF